MNDETEKIPFDIDVAMKAIRAAVKPFKKAAMFELHEEGFTSAFEQLIACIMSIRTYDEVSIESARRLFTIARTPEDVVKLSVEEIDKAITPSTFHEAKAYQIKEIAERVVKEFGGELPCDFDVLTSFKGVGPKCANLALGIACGQERISVDIHVHRVTNRWGYIATSTPEKTMVALEKVLPKKYWIEINRLLVPFGKNICTGNLPKCSLCPVVKMCRQVGVEKHR
ncbi:MAG TPA: endonuclease III [Patescibacteria group bacterium]|nr:endonuclease III [Patescibacteria group bacterium]